MFFSPSWPHSLGSSFFAKVWVLKAKELLARLYFLGSDSEFEDEEEREKKFFEWKK